MQKIIFSVGALFLAINSAHAMPTFRTVMVCNLAKPEVDVAITATLTRYSATTVKFGAVDVMSGGLLNRDSDQYTINLVKTINVRRVPVQEFSVRKKAINAFVGPSVTLTLLNDTPPREDGRVSASFVAETTEGVKYSEQLLCERVSEADSE